MLRLLHTADVHLGARHADLGDQAATQRERQFEAFGATIDLAIDERVDLVLIAGDLFDSNTQPARTVQRVAAQLRRLADAAIRSVLIPGTHDVYDRASVYRAYDLQSLAGLPAESDSIVVLTPDHPEIVLPALDAVVFGRVFATKRAPRSPLQDFAASGDTRATWKIGLIHGALAIPGRTDSDDVVITREEIAHSGLDYLALGHWHSATGGTAGSVRYAYSGAPEPVAVDQDGAGKVLLVTLEEQGTARQVTVEERVVGRTRFERVDVDTATVRDQPGLVQQLSALADPNLVLDVRLTGVLPEDLDVRAEEVEHALAGRFLRVRVRDRSVAALPEGPLPPPDTVAGAFVRGLQERIAAAELAAAAGGTGMAAGTESAAGTGKAAGTGPADAPGPEAVAGAGVDSDEVRELREVLRLGRLLLEGREVLL